MSRFRLDGRVALVTGGCRGIGWATAQALAAAGASVVLTSRDETVATERARELAETRGVDALGVGLDIADPQVVSGAMRGIYSRFKRLDALVNNAGIMPEGLLGMTSEETIQRTLAINVGGTFRMLQSAARLIERSGGGSVVNVASIMGLHGTTGLILYSASKAAVIGLTIAAAKELGPKNIRVNAVAPGFVQTDLTANLPDATRQVILSSIPLCRLGEPAEVADVILFLVSDLARYVTGQVLGVDAGMIVR